LARRAAECLAGQSLLPEETQRVFADALPEMKREEWLMAVQTACLLGGVNLRAAMEPIVPSGPRNPSGPRIPAGSRNPAGSRYLAGSRNPAGSRYLAGTHIPAEQRFQAGRRIPERGRFFHLPLTERVRSFIRRWSGRAARG